jgi:hypothetical protein
LDRGWRLSLLHQHAGKSGGRSSVSAGHAQRARMISNHLDGYEQTLPRMFITRTSASVCQLVQLLSQADRSPNGMTQSLYPGRPRGGLTNRPVSPPPAGADLRRSRGFYKSAPPRTLPVVLTAPWLHALWSILCVAICVCDPSRNTFR